MQEIERLQRHVAEFGETDPLLAFQASLYRVFGNHVRECEVLADLAQPVDEAHRADPVVVVQHGRRVGRLEVEVQLHLFANGLTVAVDLVECLQIAFVGAAARVADHSSCAADQQYHPMAGTLEMSQRHDRHNMAEMQTVGGGIKPGVNGYGLPIEVLAEFLVTYLCEKPAILQQLQQPGHDFPLNCISARHELRRDERGGRFTRLAFWRRPPVPGDTPRRRDCPVSGLPPIPLLRTSAPSNPVAVAASFPPPIRDTSTRSASA